MVMRGGVGLLLHCRKGDQTAAACDRSISISSESRARKLKLMCASRLLLLQVRKPGPPPAGGRPSRGKLGQTLHLLMVIGDRWW